MRLLLTSLSLVAVVPVIAFGLTINASALLSLLCVGLIAGSLYTMFAPADSNNTRT